MDGEDICKKFVDVTLQGEVGYVSVAIDLRPTGDTAVGEVHINVSSLSLLRAPTVCAEEEYTLGADP